MAKVTEGYMPFLGYETYYRVVGERKEKWQSTAHLFARWTWFNTQLLRGSR